MSDESGCEEELASDSTDIPIGQDFAESETEQGDAFFDLEAEEDDGNDDHDSYDEGDAGDHPSDDDKEYSRSLHYERLRRCSFPHFSRLPPELRTMIWEAVDPYLKCERKVVDFFLMEGNDIWESPMLYQQTAPARALLATCQESRSIALKHYPDAIKLRRGFGQVRFNSSNDVVLLQTPRDYNDILSIESWCDKIKYLAFDFLCSGPDDYQRAFSHIPEILPKSYGNLEAIFICYRANDLRIGRLHWTVTKFAKRFYRETFEECPGIGEDFRHLYCWPDTTLNASFADVVGEDYLRRFPIIPEICSIPVWPMIEYESERTFSLYHEVKSRCPHKDVQKSFAASFSDTSEGSSVYESEPDDYALDGFVVDSSSEGSERSSDDENDNVDVDGPLSSSNHGDPSNMDLHEENDQSDRHYDVFNGFSPLQEEPSDTEATRDMPTATFSSLEPESPNDYVSVASSLEEQPRTANQSSRYKRRIVSSDDEDDGGDGAGSDAKGHSRVKKRARLILSDSEEDDEEEGHNHSEGKQLPDNDLEEEDEDDDEEDDEEEERPGASKPMSLLARLRQFRSDVPVSPEGESPNSAGEGDEGEEDEDDEEHRFTDAEFPESAEEDGEEDGW
ncbi:hypothetical protein HD806DRAFT_510413 [Xylariaceae sp. AK1471]|nr:hypothetical protein HD806DRAFT_510413 [Xylariaceae sp. AK1471]